ncbi:MAG TPA: DHH family phosphoesterase, partial [Candidatus Dormibacteraeota bacterium]|nr:DHH family phosphoesterase [Candidatus Dormibacteraeota bacterium]
MIFGHKDADGDTLGCSLAFAEALRAEGKEVWVIVPPPLPQMYEFLPGFGEIQAEPPHGVDPQLVFFFDSGNLERSGSAVRKIATHATIVNIDHHPSNSRFGDINVIDPDASAVGQMVMQMLDHFGYSITPSIATNLYVALMTDTGGFRHENTTPQVLDDAARLARVGADPGHIATQVYKMRPETTLKLSGLALATMRVELAGRLAWAKVTRKMLREANAVMAESEGIIDTLNSI